MARRFDKESQRILDMLLDRYCDYKMLEEVTRVSYKADFHETEEVLKEILSSMEEGKHD